MPKKLKPIKYRFGWCRSGKEIAVLEGTLGPDLKPFLLSLPVDDQVDFYCVSEVWLQRFDHEKFVKGQARINARIYEILNTAAQYAPLCEALTAKNLLISANRIRFGTSLCRSY